MLDDDDDYDDEDDDGCNDHHSASNGIHMIDFFDHDPTLREKIEMRKASKPPSEWLNLLCREWAAENQVLVETTDAKFLDYKPYLKGLITSQLLCRLSIPSYNSTNASASASLKVSNDGHGSSSMAISNRTPPTDFWEILGISDSFDRAYIIAQIERFCSFYSIRAVSLEDIPEQILASDDPDVIAANMAVSTNTAGAVHGNGIGDMSTFSGVVDPAVAAAAAVAASSSTSLPLPRKLSKKQSIVIHRAVKAVTEPEQVEDNDQRQNARREQRRISLAKKEQKQREKEAYVAQKAMIRAMREGEREMRRIRKLHVRAQREQFAQEQKEAALRRAAELVTSNRVPIEITRGVAAAKAAQLAIQANTIAQPSPVVYPQPTTTKKRSAVMVSTASDLNQIVIHSKNLWAKYNAIAKEHNQKVNWITVARELGINVKVREKYARMHARAEQRGFDWVNNGHWKIKDHPEIFVEPTVDEQKAKMPPPIMHDLNHTDLISHDDAAIAAAAAVVVDASVSTFSQQQSTTNIKVLDHSPGKQQQHLLVTDPISYNDSYEDDNNNDADDDVGMMMESV